MPEGPELYMSAEMVNNSVSGAAFASPVVRSEVSAKCGPEVDSMFHSTSFTLTARARGKEVMLLLQDRKKPSSQLHLVFRFGMSGCFRFTKAEEMPKHAHLQFFTKDRTKVFCFVDQRRFGRWREDSEWGHDRGPDPMFEYKAFRRNVLDNLADHAFDKPICEVLLNQKFFNGIGNYLRAEILYRCDVAPFDQAREVLAKIAEVEDEGKDVEKELDLLKLCSLVPKEVVKLGKSSYGGDGDDSAFTSWLRCYFKEGMNNLVDSNGRTIWFAGTDAGTMAPKVRKSRGKLIKKDEESNPPEKKARRTKKKAH